MDLAISDNQTYNNDGIGDMLILPFLLAAALLLAIWLGAIGAVCLMGVAKICERLGPSDSPACRSDADFSDDGKTERLSVSDVRFLHECGIRPSPNGRRSTEEAGPESALAGEGGSTARPASRG